MTNLKKVKDGLALSRSPRLVAAAALSLMADSVFSDGAHAAIACDTQKLSGMNEQVVAPDVPQDYEFFGQTPVVIDGALGQLLRFARADNINTGLGGEHVSYVLGSQENLLGFTWMDDRFDGRQKQLSEGETDAIARSFLTCYAPELLKDMNLLWIHEHDEAIRTESGEQLTLTGMKFKARDMSTGLYFWVIVGADRNVMVFERDIRWITFPGHRGTEKWLHDSWLSEHLDEVSFFRSSNGA